MKRKEKTQRLLSNYFRPANRMLKKMLGGYMFDGWDY